MKIAVAVQIKKNFQYFTRMIIEPCFCRAQLKMCFVVLLSLCEFLGLSDLSEVTQLKMDSVAKVKQMNGPLAFIRALAAQLNHQASVSALKSRALEVLCVMVLMEEVL